ncbi:flagellar hook-length control protein FliK [Clostridium sp.]|uniref:flagellar hook-length control protein FliK n=1 Tax=Clostridium sp. TaxID=1506 RepID=UPI003D6D04B8
MNVNMNVSTNATSKKLDIINVSSKTEQFKKVLDNHEFRFRNLTNENTQKNLVRSENTKSGIEEAIAYGTTTINLNDSEDITELKAEIVKFIEISIDSAKQNPVNLDGELREELISFIQTTVDDLKQTPENLSKGSAEKDGNNDSIVQTQQVLKSLSSMFETQQSAVKTQNKLSSLKSSDIGKMIDDHLIDVEDLTPDVKNTLKDNLTKIFALIDNLDANTDELLPTQNVLEKLMSNSKDKRPLRLEIINFVQTVTEALNPEPGNKINASKPQILQILQSLSLMFETQQSGSKTKNKENDFNSVDLEKMLDDNLIGVENLTPDVKNTLKNNLTKIFALIDNSDANTDELLITQIVLEKLTREVSGVKGELDTSYLKNSKDDTSKPQIQQILQSLSLMFETKESNLKPVGLEKMIDDQLVGVENLTPATKDTLKDNIIKIFTLIEKSDSHKVELDTSYLSNSKDNASKPQIQKILQSLSLMFETHESNLKPVDLEKMLDEHLIGVEKLPDKTKNTLKNNLSNIFKLIGKSNANKYEPLKVQNVLEKLMVEVGQVKGDLSLLPKDNINVQEAQIQQIIQSLSSMFKTDHSGSMTEKQQRDVSSINIEQLIGVENLTPEAKNMLKRSFSEISVLIEKSKTNVEGSSKILQVLQKLTTQVHVVKGDLSLLKMPSPQNVIVNSEIKSIKNSSKNSLEEKFLGNLISGDKDEMKISKAINFMNQFKGAETLSTGRVETPNVVIVKSNFTVDIVKSMKFMENNNIKNLTITMSPKELGEITIKLTVESGVMKAFISAQNKDTFNLLNSNIQDISDKLRNMDIKIQSLDINIYEDSTFFNKESNKKNSNQKQNNDSKTNSVSEEIDDVLIRDNYSIEQNAVNKFV